MMAWIISAELATFLGANSISEKKGFSHLQPPLRPPSITFSKKYRKIPKIGPGGLYFSKAIFEGLIFGGAYIRRGLFTEGNLRFKNRLD